MVEVLIVCVGIVVVFFVVLAYAPQWWVGIVIVLTFTNFPAFIPPQFEVAGFAIYLHEIPLFLVAVKLFVTRPPNKSTDLLASAFGGLAAAGALYGLLSGHDIQATMNDARGLIALTLCLFITGRTMQTPDAYYALKAIRITLWVSFVLVLAGALGLIKLGGKSEDASLAGAGFYTEADVVRVLGPSTHLASATLAVGVAMWAIHPSAFPRAKSYLIPALGITVIGFSRNALVLIAVTLLLAPLINRSFRGLLRAGVIAGTVIVIFVVSGYFLSLTAGTPGLEYLRLVHSAYMGRVLEGLSSSARKYDVSSLYRQGEVDWLRRAVPGHEVWGRGFGFRYRPPFGIGFSATSGTYYAHQFYWWAVVKVGWVGMLALVSAFLTPVVYALFGAGRSALRSSTAAAIIGFMVTFTVVPIPEDVQGAPVLGVLLGLALLPLTTGVRGQQGETAAAGGALSQHAASAPTSR
ncbi:hypothetical protein Mycch_1293 [Mycolicibacterium chubuense NBB4]|uniref:O-Antigen ligase n=1 Tax=Mycolicibacterium chubuense (strain NBB4) TaxID=710421 RepID=I4BFP3_MYCCN|nr:hypothetical protein [Mycolicibacterium chubuense]AFM16100.1 hypothetical protein Mycch_1293 [Mycolicibacterium chubuense NBB4]